MRDVLTQNEALKEEVKHLRKENAALEAQNQEKDAAILELAECLDKHLNGELSAGLDEITN